MGGPPLDIECEGILLSAANRAGRGRAMLPVDGWLNSSLERAGSVLLVGIGGDGGGNESAPVDGLWVGGKEGRIGSPRTEQAQGHSGA